MVIRLPVMLSTEYAFFSIYLCDGGKEVEQFNLISAFDFGKI